LIESCRLFAITEKMSMRGRKAAQIEGIQQYDFDKLAKTKAMREKEGGLWHLRTFAKGKHLQKQLLQFE
jgi:hypothetical protein